MEVWRGLRSSLDQHLVPLSKPLSTTLSKFSPRSKLGQESADPSRKARARSIMGGGQGGKKIKGSLLDLSDSWELLMTLEAGGVAQE